MSVSSLVGRSDLMWVLIWMQVTVGIPVEYYQLNSFDSRTVCEQYREDAEVLVTTTNMAVACLSVRINQ